MCKMGPTTITKPLQKGVFEDLLGSNTPLLTKSVWSNSAWPEMRGNSTENQGSSSCFYQQ